MSVQRFVSGLLANDHPAAYYLNLMAISTDHDVLNFLSPAAINCGGLLQSPVVSHGPFF